MSKVTKEWHSCDNCTHIKALPLKHPCATCTGYAKWKGMTEQQKAKKAKMLASKEKKEKSPKVEKV